MIAPREALGALAGCPGAIAGEPVRLRVAGVEARDVRALERDRLVEWDPAFGVFLTARGVEALDRARRLAESWGELTRRERLTLSAAERSACRAARATVDAYTLATLRGRS